MRIDELTGYKSKPEYQAAKNYGAALDSHDPGSTGFWKALTSSRKEFTALLKDKGFQRVGAGAFGVVFMHPQLDYALKVFYDDPAYSKFVRYAQANPQNPHLPKFRGKMMRVSDKMLAVRMEKLTPTSGNKFLATASYYAGMIDHDPDMTIDDFFTRIHGRIPPDVIEYYEQDPSLLETLKELAIVKGGDAMFDLHEGNFMLRGDVYVVIDPFASNI